MKKLISVVAAGALLLSTAGAVFAFPMFGGVNQFSFTNSNTQAVSTTGNNSQVGKGTQVMSTGASSASAMSLTAGNVNVGGHKVTQVAGTTSATGASSSTGNNGQTNNSWFGGSQSMGTGASSAFAGSATVSNVSVSF